MSIKPTFLITDMELVPTYNETGDYVLEYKTEKAALKAAAEKLSDSCESEVWVWKLSHVLREPEIEPIIDVIK